MTNLVLAHVVTGLVGIVSGAMVVRRITIGRHASAWDGLFLVSTLAACGTGFVFLPTEGITSAQLVAFFIILLLLIAAVALFAGHLKGSWNQVYALAAVGVLFLNSLITITQTFLHVALLNAIAPTEQSAVYVAVKVTLFCGFAVVAMVVVRRAGRTSRP